jgi:hypothetical protein
MQHAQPQPRLPHWGHLSPSADGNKGRLHLFSSGLGADSAADAVAQISRFVEQSGAVDAREARVKVRPRGEPNGTPAAREVTIAECDPIFGLSDGQRQRVLAVLDGPIAPNLELVFTFKRDR